MGLTFESDGPVERRAMHCPQGYITGLQVRHGRDNKADTDMYDFKLKCGGRWGPWSGMTFGNFKEEKTMECPLKMHMTGLEVKQGRKEMGDVDTYDFKLQCSGVWQPYMGLAFSNQQTLASKECPSGTMAWGWRAYRGFVKRGDRDYYEFDLNCKAADDGAAAVRRAPALRDLGLPQNVFVWTAKDVGVWLSALGLGEYASAFARNKLQGDVIFLLLESHLQDLGMSKIGDRLYFMEVLTQLHDATNRLAKVMGAQLASTRTLPDLRRAGLPTEVVSWSVKEVAGFLRALGLSEWIEAFLKHRIQGDVMFSLTEVRPPPKLAHADPVLAPRWLCARCTRVRAHRACVSCGRRPVLRLCCCSLQVTLAEMGVDKIGDRLFLVDCLQSLYEELTAWKAAREKAFTQKVRATVPALPGGGNAGVPQLAGAPSASGYGAGAGGGGASGGVSGGRQPSALLQQLLSQGYSMQEVLALAKQRPDLMAQLFR